MRYRAAASDVLVETSLDTPPTLLESWQHARELIAALARTVFRGAADPVGLQRSAVVTHRDNGVHVRMLVLRDGHGTERAEHGDGTVDFVISELQAFFAPFPSIASHGLEHVAIAIPPEPVRQHGRIGLLTSSGSFYEVNLTSMHLRRHPNQTEALAGHAPSTDLRRDDQAIKILSIEHLKVGESAVFRLEPLGDPSVVSFTTRTTTDVVEIIDLDTTSWQ